MNADRLQRLVLWDIRVQARERIYLFTAVTTAAFALIAILLPDEAPVTIITGILLLDPSVVGTGFVAALVLLERSQSTLPALAVTPAAPAEYVTAKLFTFTTLTVVGGLVIMAAWAWPAPIPLLIRMVVALTCTGAVAVLAGLVIVATAQSLNHVIARLIPVSIVIYLPLLAHFGLVDGWFAWVLFGLNPGHAMLRGTLWAADPAAVSPIEAVYAFGYLALLGSVLFRHAVRLHTDTLGRTGG